MYYFLLFVILFGLLPLLYYSLLYRSITRETGFIFLLLVSIFVASLYEFIFTCLLHVDVTYWFTTYTVIAFLSIHRFFYLLLNKRYKLVFLAFLLVFLFFLFFNYTIWSEVYYLDICGYFNTLQTFVILTFSILWFRRVFINHEVDSFTDSPSFYFVAGLLFYYCGTVFLFLMGSIILKMEKSTFVAYWEVNIVLNLILRTLLILGIWKGQMK